MIPVVPAQQTLAVTQGQEAGEDRPLPLLISVLLQIASIRCADSIPRRFDGSYYRACSLW